MKTNETEGRNQWLVTVCVSILCQRFHFKQRPPVLPFLFFFLGHRQIRVFVGFTLLSFYSIPFNPNTHRHTTMGSSENGTDKSRQQEQEQEQEPILMEQTQRFCMFPIRHKQLWEMYKKAEASFWTGRYTYFIPQFDHQVHSFHAKYVPEPSVFFARFFFFSSFLYSG